jgi:glutamyl-Q tRNA(Asp) synthetase
VEGYVYPGTCRSRLRESRAARALRINTLGAAALAFEDALQGRIAQDLERDAGDFVLYRSDGVFAYQLAAAVDDAEQGITDVVRGADLMNSTPRQIYLQRLLGLPTPRYAHLPVALDARGEKLSKQTHAPAIDRHRPLRALIAALGFLGQSPPEELACGSVEQFWRWAIQHWRLASVPRVPTQIASYGAAHQ